MKKFLALILCAAISVSLFAANGDIQYVNMETLFGKYWQTLEKDNAFKERKLRADKIIKLKVEQMQRLKDEGKQYLNDSTNLGITKEKSDQLVAKARKCDSDIRNLESETQDFARSQGEELRKEYLNMRNGIVKELTDFIKGYRKENKLEMIVDVSGMTTNGVPVIIGYDETKDITEALLSHLNKGKEKFVEEQLAARKKDQEAAEAAAAAPAAPAPAEAAKQN